MTHDRAHALLLDLAYGELAADEASEVSRHAAECSECAAELERIGAVRARAARLSDGPAQAGGRDALIEAARRAVASRPTRRWFTRPATLSFGAAAAVLAIVAGVTLKLTSDDLRPAGEESGPVSAAPPAANPPRDLAAQPPPAMTTAQPEAPAAAPPPPARQWAEAPVEAAPIRRPAARRETKDAAPAIAAAPASPSAPPGTEDEAAPASPRAAVRAEDEAASATAGSAPRAEGEPASAAAGAARGPARSRAMEAAPDEERLWRLLERGGQVVLLRHASTEPGLGDPPGFRLGQCSTQRNLSEAGRDEARRLGGLFRARGIPVGRVLSSRWCRCLDTARLAFGRAEGWPPLDSFFDDRSREADQTAAVRRVVAEVPAGGNLVLVTHQVNITALSGISPAPGELVILTPRGDGDFAVAGRLSPAGTGR